MCLGEDLTQNDTREGPVLNRRMKLIGIWVAVMALMLSVVAGCGGAKPNAGGKITLQYWTGWTGFEFDELQKLVDKFNQEHSNIEVKMTTVAGQYEKVLTAVAAKNPPDVVSAVWQNQLASMASKDGLAPLDDYINASTVINMDDFMPQLREAWRYNGKTYGIAITANSSMILYNKQALREAGLPDRAPQDWAEFNQWNEQLVKFDNQGNLLQTGYVPTDLWFLGNMFGGKFYDPATNKITANDPRIVDALTHIQSWAKIVPPEKVDAFSQGFGQFLSENNPFFVSKQVMAGGGEYMTAIAEKYAPDLEFEYMAFPAPPGGLSNATPFGGSIFTIPVGVKHPKESWAFIEWLAKPENMGAFTYAINNMPTRNSVAQEQRFQERKGFKLAYDLLGGPNAFGPIQIPVFEFYLLEMQKTVDAVRRGEKEPKAALDELTALVQAELDKSR